MSRIVNFLHDPYNVFAFQNYFGLKWKKNRKEDTGEASNGNETHNREMLVGNRFWFYIFTFGTGLGSELFYLFLFPFWFWNIDGAVGRRIAAMWCLSMYIGQGLKDIICWPRPSSPPVIQAPDQWVLEYGMPSTHAMISVVIPFSTLMLTTSRYNYPGYIGLFLACTYCILVSSSRLYLGMHSLADVLAGIILGLVLLTILHPLTDAMDSFILTHPASPVILATAAVTLMHFYPRTKFSSAREDTAIILGGTLGLLFGSWMCYQLGSIRGPPMEPPYEILWPSFEMLGRSILRTIIGLITVVLTRAVMKPTATVIMKSLVQLVKGNTSYVKMGDVVTIGSKMICYTFVGFEVICVAPALFHLLNIERPTFYTEV